MSCIASGNTRCTKCCDAPHIDKKQYLKVLADKITIVDQDKLIGKAGAWQAISARQAKKINPYMFTAHPDIKHTRVFFRCKVLIKGVGCPIRNTDKHPDVCKIYTGGSEYSPTCEQDINIIARGG